ncbi:MAG TPA: YdeI/OmpD-associated family protein [Candidatus Eisenbacteria bacterium]|nr:YdeI/OmpD-associated family protein [Candidatus Eisenbacteria bacterium]
MTGDGTRRFPDRSAWEKWLAANHAAADGIWIKFARKDSGIRTISHEVALEVALSYGWIDGLGRKFDEDFWLLRFTPRRPQSKWSKINRDKAVELIKTGKMKPAGLREVERAKADGRWEAAYPGSRAATVPDDLQRELDKNERALKFFATLNSQNRYAILYRIHEAKKPETRSRRIEKFVAMLNDQQKIYP